MSPSLVRCRSCAGSDLVTVLDLGLQPLADELVAPERGHEEDDRFPVAIAFCRECTLVQVLDDVSPARLFGSAYRYFSSYSDQVAAHVRRHVRAVIEERRLGADSLVVEIGSNDGYLLRHFVADGVPVLGVEPAPAQADAAAVLGIPTYREFFGRGLAEALLAEHGPADVIVANNVLAHVPDLNGVVAGIARLVSDDGVITVENPWVADLVRNVEFDTVYHEHRCYFSCTAIDGLVRRHGLHLNHVEHFPRMHGGTLRWWISKADERTDECRAFLEREQEHGVTSLSFYEGFGARARDVCARLRGLLAELRADGARVAAYGAAAKGAMLLNVAGISTEVVEYVVDRNPHKHGLLMPGTRQPVLAAEELLARRPTHVLVLAWNFLDEITAQQRRYLDEGGRFIVPIPEPRLVPA